jgi:hypothetical protein
MFADFPEAREKNLKENIENHVQRKIPLLGRLERTRKLLFFEKLQGQRSHGISGTISTRTRGLQQPERLVLMDAACLGLRSLQQKFAKICLASALSA